MFLKLWYLKCLNKVYLSLTWFKCSFEPWIIVMTEDVQLQHLQVTMQ